MKILFIIDSLEAGGAETSLVDSIPTLIRLGIEPHVVTTLSRRSSLYERLHRSDVPVTELGDYHPLLRLKRLNAVIREFRPQLIHSTLLRSDILGRISATLNRIPSVSTIANDSYNSSHQESGRYGRTAVKAAWLLDAVTAQTVTRFHAISEVVADSMGSRLHIPASKIEVVWRGRDPGRLGKRSDERRNRVRNDLGISDAPVILHPARHDKQKGVDLSIRAFDVLRRSFPDAVLLLAGRPGNASAEILDLVDQIGPQGIRFLGERSDVPDLMCAADVISFPTRWEGLGGALIEAMALELPIVASDIAPVREVTGDVAFALIPLERSDLLATQLERVLHNTGLASAKTQLGRHRFEDEFTIDRAANKMVDFYMRSMDVK